MQSSIQIIQAELERLSLQQRLLQENEIAVQQTGNDIKKLDASVKRNTTLIKRLRNITEDSAASLLDDIARTNQSKVQYGDLSTVLLLLMSFHSSIAFPLDGKQ